MPSQGPNKAIKMTWDGLGMDFKEMVTALNTLEPERMKTSSGFSEDESRVVRGLD